MNISIPLFQPDLPTHTQLQNWLKQIDHNQIYSNFGPLLHKFENGLAQHFNLSPAHIATANNGTLALAAGLFAIKHEQAEKPFCFMPAWTFAASAHAAVLAGFEPYFLDVDAGSGMLTPELAEAQIPKKIPAGSVVMCVPPFGTPLDARIWDKFTARTHIPAIIDAAAGFDSLIPGKTPAMISIHATKCFSIGEGGVLLSRDAALVARARAFTNFGFQHDRLAHHFAINAKLSEYAAAIGLAQLKRWPGLRRAYLQKAVLYKKLLATKPDIHIVSHFADVHAVSTFHVRHAHISADQLIYRLKQHGIASRRWWGSGCHTMPAFAHCERSNLINSESWINQTLGLPFSSRLSRDDIKIIVNSV